MDLSTTIADVRFSTCLMNAAGALCVTREELEALGRCRSGAIVTKSMTPAFRQGNPGAPVLQLSPGAPSIPWGFPISAYSGLRHHHSNPSKVWETRYCEYRRAQSPGLSRSGSGDHGRFA